MSEEINSKATELSDEETENASGGTWGARMISLELKCPLCNKTKTYAVADLPLFHITCTFCHDVFSVRNRIPEHPDLSQYY